MVVFMILMGLVVLKGVALYVYLMSAFDLAQEQEKRRRRTR